MGTIPQVMDSNLPTRADHYHRQHSNHNYSISPLDLVTELLGSVMPRLVLYLVTERSGNERFVACSPNMQRIASGFSDNTIHVWDSFPRASLPLCLSCYPLRALFCTLSDHLGQRLGRWLIILGAHRSSYRPTFTCSSHNLSESHIRSVSLDFEHFAFGTLWAETFDSTWP